MTFLLQGPQQLVAVVGISSNIEDLFQPACIEQDGVMQVGGVRANLQEKEVQVSRRWLVGSLGGGSPQ